MARRILHKQSRCAAQVKFGERLGVDPVLRSVW
jgi:hypothetical protein